MDPAMKVILWAHAQISDEEVVYDEAGETLEQAVLTGCGWPIPGSVQGHLMGIWEAWSSETYPGSGAWHSQEEVCSPKE